MDVTLWIIQAMLGLVFIVAGVLKLIYPKERLVARMPFIEDLSQGVITWIGVVEVLAAVGIILPALTGILPWLTPSAAVGLGVHQLGAAWTHWRRNEYPMIGVNAVLLAMAVFVAYGRFISAPG